MITEKKNLFHYDFLWFNVVQVYGRFVVKTFFCNTNDPSSKTVRFEIPSWFHELLINEIFNELRPNSDCRGNLLLGVGLGCSSHLGYHRHNHHHNLLVVAGVAVAGHPNLLVVVVALGHLVDPRDFPCCGSCSGHRPSYCHHGFGLPCHRGGPYCLRGWGPYRKACPGAHPLAHLAWDHHALAHLSFDHPSWGHLSSFLWVGSHHVGTFHDVHLVDHLSFDRLSYFVHVHHAYLACLYAGFHGVFSVDFHAFCQILFPWHL